MKRVVPTLFASLMAVAGAARAAPPPRLVEAFAEKDFDRKAAVRIAPMSAKQASDPTYRTLANLLAETLLKADFNVVGPKDASDFAVTLEYSAVRGGMSSAAEGSIVDTAYRSVIVTGYDIRDPKLPRFIWQTLLDQGGVSLDIDSTIPVLIKAGGSFYGQNKTGRGMNVAQWCADHVPLLGTKISVVCDMKADRPYRHLAAQTLGSTNKPASAGTIGGGSGP